MSPYGAVLACGPCLVCKRTCTTDAEHQYVCAECIARGGAPPLGIIGALGLGTIILFFSVVGACLMLAIMLCAIRAVCETWRSF